MFTDADNNTFFAIRGTEASYPMDLLTDLIDMTRLGRTALQPEYISLRGKVVEWLENGTLPQDFTLTGDSLGGFLAAGLVAEPVLADHISHAYMLNSPGVGGHSGPFAMVYAILDFLGVVHLPFDQSKISNIEAATGSKSITGFGFDIAPSIDIVIEDQMASDISNLPGARNHSQQALIDAYSQLTSNLEQAQLNKLMDASGSTKDVSGASISKTLESDVDALRVTF
ncbi:MAG: hypothetical protein E6Q59_09025 [Nitrosomonas sp.]|nr:DUF2974 domain-containing protein [Nitrosomonas sp.]OQW84197.1 MAG: hypothetical protein BVN30_04180 [Proteobacteria bacterium ST_bin16]TXI36648.1 MAG: hypothetical protein E6Q59_09025 [Nitrosomonas sp.]